MVMFLFCFGIREASRDLFRTNLDTAETMNSKNSVGETPQLVHGVVQHPNLKDNKFTESLRVDGVATADGGSTVHHNNVNEGGASVGAAVAHDLSKIRDAFQGGMVNSRLCGFLEAYVRSQSITDQDDPEVKVFSVDDLVDLTEDMEFAGRMISDAKAKKAGSDGRVG